MESFKEFLKKSYIFILIFVLAFALRCVGIIKKDCMFFDSTSSIVITTPNNIGPEGRTFKKTWKDFDFISGKVYTGKELKKAFFETSANPTEILKDITSTIHIEKVDDLADYSDLIKKSQNIGITAGASTPDYLINEVLNKLKQY